MLLYFDSWSQQASEFAKVANRAARESLPRGVREHGDSIRTELVKIDLSGTPYKGPVETNFLSDREKFGTDYLACWSSVGALEELLTASIVEGGADLRRTSLREGLRGMLDVKANELDLLLQTTEPRSEAAERKVEKLLDVLGYIEGDERKKYLGDDGPDLLSALEEARGEIPQGG